VQATLGPLLPLFERERSAGRALVLGVLVHTSGSTYQKPGALILIAASGDYAGLISGGCLEGDLREHARQVMADGQARSVRYDLRGPQELLWGLGLGCEGTMRIVLVRCGPENDWQPLQYFAAARRAHQPAAVGLVCDSSRSDVPVGTLVLPQSVPAAAPLASTRLHAALGRASAQADSLWYVSEARDVELFLLPLALPPRILVLGAGPDAVPVVDLAVRLNWKVTLVDHRAAYASRRHFPCAEQLLAVHPQELPTALDLGAFDAAVIMSHHLPSDLAYLRCLAPAAIPYVGLLGPAARRDKLLGELGADAAGLRGRLHAPIGLPLGGRTPEAIALAIVAQLQAFLHAGALATSAPSSPARAAAAEPASGAA
jgi:xanthine/CO dehydrogenase XdhC/CoxF family maturation factor